jgi:ParB-like chromosome segregation protein Spo0J
VTEHETETRPATDAEATAPQAVAEREIGARHAAEMTALLDEHHEKRKSLIDGTLDGDIAAYAHAVATSSAIAAMAARHRREANPPPPKPVAEAAAEREGSGLTARRDSV